MFDAIVKSRYSINVLSLSLAHNVEYMASRRLRAPNLSNRYKVEAG